MLKESFSFVIGTRYNVNRNQLTHATGCCRTRFGRSFNRTDIASNQDSHVTIEKVFLAHEDDVCSLDHRVGSLDSANQAARFNHSEGFHEVANLPESILKSN
jgi:hypothetical protein